MCCPYKDKFEFLKKMPIFSEAEDDVLMELASSLTEKEVLKGATS